MSNETEVHLRAAGADICAYVYTVPPGDASPEPPSGSIRSMPFQAASAQYNNSLWNVHTINSDTYPTPRFYQINTDTNTMVQSGDFFDLLLRTT